MILPGFAWVFLLYARYQLQPRLAKDVPLMQEVGDLLLVGFGILLLLVQILAVRICEMNGLLNKKRNHAEMPVKRNRACVELRGG